MKSKFTVNDSYVYISDNMSGKMSGIPSISSACFCNALCKARAAKDSMICKHCFAMKTTARYKALAEHLKDNYELLTSRVLSDDELPKFSYAVGMVRIESFGDIANVIQAMNYLNIARINPHVRFGWWTKNPGFISAALKALGIEKPENVRIIYSSPIVNDSVKYENVVKAFPFVDSVFTVYDKKTVKSQNIEINCGARSCAACGRCYFGNEHDIREQLK